MKATPEQARRHSTVAPRRRLMRAVLAWWWNLDRRRHIAQLDTRNRLHPMDEAFVVEAMAGQLEEIRNLPELAG
jgi:hypothetical protein